MPKPLSGLRVPDMRRILAGRPRRTAVQDRLVTADS